MKTCGVVCLLCSIAAASLLAWRAPDAASAVQFVEATTPAGLKFVHNSGRAGKKFLPETMGSGGDFVDLNGDGWLDIVLINGKDWTPKAKRSLSAIYKNNGNGTFSMSPPRAASMSRCTAWASPPATTTTTGATIST